MNFLEKLEMLMNYKNINKRQLSIGSDIPYSTIDNLWKKGYDNIKLSTLKKLSDYFNVSLDFLVRDELENDEPIIKKAPTEQLGESDFQKRRLLHNYDKLNQTGKDKLVDYSDDLKCNPKYMDTDVESGGQRHA